MKFGLLPIHFRTPRDKVTINFQVNFQGFQPFNYAQCIAQVGNRLGWHVNHKRVTTNKYPTSYLLFFTFNSHLVSYLITIFEVIYL